MRDRAHPACVIRPTGRLDHFRGAGLVGWALVAQLLVSCGGATSRQTSGNPPVTSGGTAGAAPSSVAGAGGAAYPTGCEAMDAKASGARCASLAGYRWNGQLCEAIA